MHMNACLCVCIAAGVCLVPVTVRSGLRSARSGVADVVSHHVGGNSTLVLSWSRKYS